MLPKKLLITIFLFVVSSTIQILASNPREYFRVAKYNYDHQEYEKALKFVNLVINADSSFISAYFLRAQINFKMSDYPQVIQDISTAFTRSGENSNFFSDYYMLRAEAFEQLGNHDFARKDIDRVIELSQNNDGAYYLRARINGQTDHLKEAIQDLDEAIRLKSDSGEYYAYRAMYKNEYYSPMPGSDIYESIVADINVAVALDPKNYNFHQDRLEILGKSWNADKRLAEVDRLIDLFPDQAEVYTEKGYMLIQQYQFKQAIGHLSKAITLNATEEKNYRLRALSYYNTSQYKYALHDYNIAIEKLIQQFKQHSDDRNIKKVLAETFMLRGLTYSAMGYQPEACENFSASAKLGSVKGYNCFCKSCNVFE